MEGSIHAFQCVLHVYLHVNNFSLVRDQGDSEACHVGGKRTQIADEALGGQAAYCFVIFTILLL